MADEKEEKPGQKDSTDRKLDWVVKNPLWAVVILLGWLYYNKDKRLDEVNQQAVESRENIIKYQNKLIDGFDRLNEQTQNAERISRSKKDSNYVR